jgi:hypothetical protein
MGLVILDARSMLTKSKHHLLIRNLDRDDPSRTTPIANRVRILRYTPHQREPARTRVSWGEPHCIEG